MRTIRPNLDQFKLVQGSKTLSAFAAELGVNKSTLSRVLDTTHPAEPGPRFIAAVLATVPHTFEDLFDVEEV